MKRLTRTTGRNRRSGEFQTRASSGPKGLAHKQRALSLPVTVSRRELLDDNGASDGRFRQLLYDMSTLASHLESARAFLAGRIGLSSPQYNITMIVARFQKEEGVSVSEVAQHLHVSTAFVTSEAGKLETAGLIVKRQNPRDGRGILLRLSPLGEKKVREVGPVRLLVNDQLFRSISGEDFRHLAQTIASLIDDFAGTIQMLKTLPEDQIRRAAELSRKRG
jgi:DNA-binding MarR family transcriptional regulator